LKFIFAKSLNLARKIESRFDSRVLVEMIAVMSAGACLLAVSKPSLSLAAYMPVVQQLLGFDKLTTNRPNQQAASSLVVLKKVLKSSGF
jgi:hypothetical protein